MKKFLAGFMAFVLMLTSPAYVSLGYVGNEKGKSDASAMLDGEGMTVKGTNSFGTMLADILSDKMDEQDSNDGCNLFSVDITGDKATVSFETTKNATLVIGIYNENGIEMKASGKADVMAGDTEAVVTIEIDAMPDYFYLRGFLVDSESLRPLCTAYESPNYTREMQEFFNKTIDDFKGYNILNLDEDKNNNFAVYNESTKIISGSAIVLSSVDEENHTYIFENADDQIKTLNEGEIFAYEYRNENGNDDILIVKVASVKVIGDHTVEVTGADTSMKDVFEYIKIEATSAPDMSDIQVGTSGGDEDVRFDGIKNDPQEDLRLNAVDVDGKVSASFNYTLLESVYNLISGDVSFKTEISLKVYLSFKHQYLELKCDCNLKINVKISGKTDIKKIKLGPPLGFVVAPGVIVEFTPSFLIQASAEISGSFQLSGTIGFKLESGTGLTNLTSQPKVKMESKGEVSIFIGISFEPKLKILSDQIASTSLEAAVGVEIKGTRIFETSKISSSEVHECKDCVDGDIVGKIDVSFKLGFFNIENLTYKLQKSSSVKMFDWYLSLDFGEFGFTTCPHIMYKSTVVVTDQNGEPIKDALVELPYTITDPPFENKLVTSVVTDSEGNAEGYLKNGTYTAKISANGYESTTKNVTIKNFAKKFKIKLNKLGGSGGGGGSWGSNSDVFQNQKTVSLGYSFSGAITEDGSLYVWGQSTLGRLGYITMENQVTPKKILDHVVSVSLGKHHAGAITEDGSLYMWGSNEYGQVGGGASVSNEPIKVLDNVVFISLGAGHSGAITKDGSLYMWGWNKYGQIGDGTTENVVKPKKILDSVRFISLGSEHSGAITKDGDLYMWGDNEYGAIGDGTSENRSKPKKVLSNVASISLGTGYTGAINKSGNLYMWGSNYAGCLGYETSWSDTEEHYSPHLVLGNVVSVSLGWCYSGVVTRDGSLYMWGDNEYGVLGDGTTETNSVPIKIRDGVAAVSLGYNHSGAVMRDGSLYMWGNNDDGQLGDGTTTSTYVPIKVLDNVRIINKQTNIQKLNSFSVDTLSIKQSENLNLSQVGVVNDRSDQISAFTNLIPYATYMFYMVKDRSVDDILNTSNLLYLTQAVANADGNLSVTYVPKETIADAAVFLVEHKISMR